MSRGQLVLPKFANFNQISDSYNIADQKGILNPSTRWRSRVLTLLRLGPQKKKEKRVAKSIVFNISSQFLVKIRLSKMVHRRSVNASI